MISQSTKYFNPSGLKRLCSDLLQKMKIPPKDAELIAESLVQANLRGVDSHGVARMAIYIERLNKRLTNPKPRITILQEMPAMALVNGDNGSGQVVAKMAMELTMDKARQSGVALVGIRNSTHFGATAFFSMKALAPSKRMSLTPVRRRALRFSRLFNVSLRVSGSISVASC